MLCPSSGHVPLETNDIRPSLDTVFFDFTGEDVQQLAESGASQQATR